MTFHATSNHFILDWRLSSQRDAVHHTKMNDAIHQARIISQNNLQQVTSFPYTTARRPRISLNRTYNSTIQSTLHSSMTHWLMSQSIISSDQITTRILQIVYIQTQLNINSIFKVCGLECIPADVLFIDLTSKNKHLFD